MTNELAKANDGGVQITPAANRHQILILDQTLKAARQEIATAAAEGNEILKALTLATATQRLRQLLTPELMQDVMALQNTPLGFKTDRAPGNKKSQGPYPVEIVRDVAISAMLDGARLCGNEFNIIASNYYRTLEQFERRIREFPGLSDLRLEIGVPTCDHQRGSALVDVRAAWKLHGKADSIACCKTNENDTRIPLKIDDYTGIDAMLGKAKRKFLARLLDHLDGSSYEAQDAVIEGAVVSATVTPELPPLESHAATSTASADSPPVQQPSPAETQEPPPGDKLLEDCEGLLLTCDMVTDARRVGEQMLDRIAAHETAGHYSPAKADMLRKMVAGLVENQCDEIRAARGQRRE